MAKVIKNVDFHCKANNIAHRTIEITAEQLIVRRGQSFLMALEMTPPFANCELFVITLETGSAPSEKYGTRSEFGNPSPMYTSDVKAIWKYNIDKTSKLQQGIVALSVTPPADAPVGRYRMSISARNQSITLGTLVVLFNPWCSDDWVYLPDERERQEYVMNEQGLIYTGTSRFIQPMAWIFGQFEEEMVDICLKLLDVNPQHARNPANDVSARCNPIYVSRVISAMINCNGDRGVLEGRWEGDCSDGVNPTRWIGSISILKQWYQKGCNPVKYGQCWVFAGVMCTVMRFLGIPCRVVTNFESGHDTDNNLTIDKTFNEYGAADKDSIWNFHVWVEGWMKRPDLKKGNRYDGWQVLDPTPQEKREFCCGPAPVAALLQGEVNLKYDVPFVFSEVNADIVNWMVTSRGLKKKIHCDTATVGQKISTKAVGCDRREDITHSYKPREGSSKEREVFRHACNRLNSGDNQHGHGGEQPRQIEMKLEEDTKMLNGQDIILKLKLSNRDHKVRILSIRVNAQGMRYNGKPIQPTLETTIQEKTILPGQDVMLPFKLAYSVYNKMVGCNSIKVSAVATDAANKQEDSDIYGTDIDIALENPPITIKVVGEARVYSPMTTEVEFTNPLNEMLRYCSLTVSGCGLFKEDYKSNVKELAPHGTMRMEIETVPYKAGLKHLVANFDCSAFRDVKGSCVVEVKH